jgi:TonB family protein
MKQGEFMRDRGLDALCKCPLAGVILVVCLVMASLTVSASGNSSAGDVCCAAGDYDEVFVSVEKMPLFPGGEAALMTYIRDNITYPATAADKNIQGKVVVQFVVDTAGQVGDVKVVRSVDDALDREAVRVVKTLPSFTPGIRKGKPVNVWYTLPVNFKLENDISYLLSYIHDVDSILIDHCDLNINTPQAITPADYDAGQLRQSRNTFTLKRRVLIRNMVKAMGGLAKLSQGHLDTRGKMTLYFKNGKKNSFYFDQSTLYFRGNCYDITTFTAAGAEFRKILFPLIN